MKAHKLNMCQSIRGLEHRQAIISYYHEAGKIGESQRKNNDGQNSLTAWTLDNKGLIKTSQKYYNTAGYKVDKPIKN